ALRGFFHQILLKKDLFAMIVKAVSSELTVQLVWDADGCVLHNIVLTVCCGEKWENRFWIIRHYIVITTKQCGTILNSINLRAITIYERFFKPNFSSLFGKNIRNANGSTVLFRLIIKPWLVSGDLTR